MKIEIWYIKDHYRSKKGPEDCEKISENHISDKGLICGIRRELSKLTKAKQSSQRRVNDLKRHFSCPWLVLLHNRSQMLVTSLGSASGVRFHVLFFLLGSHSGACYRCLSYSTVVLYNVLVAVKMLYLNMSETKSVTLCILSSCESLCNSHLLQEGTSLMRVK